jgi:fatty-acyl-CoA synthase
MPPAIIDGATGERRTRSELAAAAVRLAGALSHRFGVRRGDRVAVISYNRAEVFETMFACRRLGAVMVPLGWRLAAAERAAIVADCAPRALLFDQALAADARLLDLPSASFDHVGGDARGLRARDRHPDAMLLYTSGSTGRPKGVIVTWRQIAFNAAVTVSALGLGPRDRCLGVLPLWHTGGLHCLATPLLTCGGSVVLTDRFDPDRALELICEAAITCVIAVPTMYQMLLDAGLGAGGPVRSLRHLLIGGAGAPDALFERYRAIGHPLRHGYGLTEAGPNCFSFGDRSVGWPMGGTRARIADDGELWLSGPHVAAGYWNGVEASTFAGGWLRTGDLAREAADGVHIVGRKKEMFISGGENVYPGEVENALAAHPGVAQVCVVGVPDERWGEVGLAAVVPMGSQLADVSGLREFARARLAPFKVPHHWRVVPDLPRGSTGKILRSDVARQWRETRD